MSLRDCSMTIQRGDNTFTASLGQYGFDVYTNVDGEEFLCGSCPTSGALDMLETFLAVSSKRAVRTKKNVGVGHMYVDGLVEVYY